MPAAKALATEALVRQVAKRRKAKRQKAPKATKKKKEHEPKPALRAYAIFCAERRPAIIEAIHANSEAVTAADIDRRLTALWDVETDRTKYYALENRDRERYADEKATFHSEGAVKKKAATPKNRAASFEDSAQAPSAHDEVSPHSASLPAAASSVYSYAVGYLQPFLVRVNGSQVDSKRARHQRTRWVALQLMAAGREPLRAPTCNHALRVASGGTTTGQALLRRALLLLGPGELQELRELRAPFVKAGTCDFIQSMLEQEAAGSRLQSESGTPRDAPVSRALASIRVIKGEHVTLTDGLLLQCAATLAELDCAHLGRSAHSIVPRCTRLESLTLRSPWWWAVAPWFELSQLHTLRGVNLTIIPAAVLAARLPRLQTLHVNNSDEIKSSVAAVFYDELLPRLRSFHLEGPWLKTSDDTETFDVPPLPLLEDLKWLTKFPAKLPRRLMDARPSTLDTSGVDLVEWLQTADSADADSPPVASPLARVRALTVRFRAKPPDPGCMARLLRAAPHLRQLTFDMYGMENPLRVFLETFTLEPASAGVVHSKLRHIAVTSKYFPPDLPVPVPAGCGVRLRQRHFPALRRFTVDDEEHPVWVPPRRAGRKIL
jgi:hypothetical protein